MSVVRPPTNEAELTKWRDLVSDFTRYGWRDEKGSLQTARQAGGLTQATWAQVGATNFSAYSFSASVTNSLQVSFHAQHDLKKNGSFLLHMHWSSAGTGTCRWGFEFVQAKGHQQEGFDHTSSTTVYVEQVNELDGSIGKHMIAEFDLADSLTDLEPDALITVRVFRDGGHANDTLNAVAYGYFCDCHYEIDRFSTPNRSPNFYR